MENKKENTKSKLIEEFKDDPIYKMIVLENLVDEVFSDAILRMNLDSNYTLSTVEASKILGVPNSTIRNYFHHDLIKYILPEKWGRYYRLNYRSIFKLKMLMTLIDKANKTRVDLLTILGMSPAIVLEEENHQKIKQSRYLPSSEVNPLYFQLAYLIKYQNELNELKLKLNKKINDKKEEISKLQLTFLEEKQNALTDNYLRTLTDKSSFWKKKVKKKENASELQDRINKLKEKFRKEIETKSKKYDEEIERIKMEISEKEELIKTKQNEISENNKTNEIINNIEG